MQTKYLHLNIHSTSTWGTNQLKTYTDPYEISRIINSFKRKSSSGHDGITTSLIKDTNQDIAIALTIVINKSINTGIVPESMKLAKAIPIYEAKDKEILSNHRPISLPSFISKILEIVIHRRHTQSVFYPSQYGFRPKHATTHAISEFVDETIAAFENSNNMLGVIMNLSKAFDTIDHVIFLCPARLTGGTLCFRVVRPSVRPSICPYFRPSVRHVLGVPLCVQRPAKAMPFQQIIMHALQCQHDLDVHLLFCIDLDLHITSSRGRV